MSETGVAGLALGGGIGWFSRKHGLTCDNFVSLELVLASGEVIEVSADSHPELFWALRGGGGNFGIVTRFTFRAYDFGPMMRIGVSVYEPEQAAAALRGYASVVPTLPRTVGWHAALKHDMPVLPFVRPEYVGKRLLMLISMWLDDAEDPEGAEMITRLTEIGEPCIKATTVLPFGAGVQRLIDTEFQDGHRYYTKEAHVAELADDAIDALVGFWQDMPMEGEVQVEIIGLGGAIGDVAETDTAFSNRGYLLWLNFAMRWSNPADDTDYIGRTRMIVAALAPWVGQRRLRQHAQLRRAGPRGRSPRRPGEVRQTGPPQGPLRPAEPLPHELQHPSGLLKRACLSPGSGPPWLTRRIRWPCPPPSGRPHGPRRAGPHQDLCRHTSRTAGYRLSGRRPASSTPGPAIRHSSPDPQNRSR